MQRDVDDAQAAADQHQEDVALGNAHQPGDEPGITGEGYAGRIDRGFRMRTSDQSGRTAFSDEIEAGTDVIDSRLAACRTALPRRECVARQ
jgi:hypothetical protein